MKKILGSIFSGFVTAFSMYSIIPMPQIAWKKDSMKYALCFFPLVGGVIGGAVFGWSLLCLRFEISPILFAAVATILPVLISGGIHLDGFIDTSDALYSRQERERKLEILSDPHVGAFGVIMCGGYLLLQFGVYAQLYGNMRLLPLVLLSFLLSRSLSALAVITFRKARNKGLAATFSDNADRGAAAILALLCVIFVGMFCAVDLLFGSISAIASVGWFLLYRRLCYREFGGITGDLAGFFLQVCEVLLLIAATLGEMIC